MKIKEVVARLHALKYSAKIIHWKLTGSRFFELHNYMDEVAEPIDNFIDDLMENYFMAEETESLKTIEYTFKTDSSEYYVSEYNTPDDMIRNLLEFIIELSNGIEDINTYRGVNAILDEISSYLMKVKALLRAYLA